ncbi:energy-coupling factor ABC transporter ATP-binding protein [Treponema denticola]|uniref:ABC transporter ATP-binding protein n=1 Tax=Treponema denticola TaxID=158 RepID=UPI0020A57CB4|nr:energy-coupling factor ABC transporter ATP-binding protein [Treponema denticola]UTC96374.1 energy-coupling factor ABC transporter ATP-binding protein [Treponema denticola]
MIRMENVSFHYENSERGVSDINLTINEGECTVLTGPSGGGKTTILRLLNGLAPGYYGGTLSGNIFIGGKDMSSTPLWERGKFIGSVFQEPQSQFFSSELAGEIAFSCENYGLAQEEIIARTEEAIEAFHLAALRDHTLDTFSSGEKQRAAIASVYALSPSIYVCDEPTANLDEESAVRLSHVLKKLKEEGRTLIIAEHRLSWLYGIADRFIYIDEGTIQWVRRAEAMQKMTLEQKKLFGLRSFTPALKPALPPPSSRALSSGTANEPLLQADGIYRKEKGNLILQTISFPVWRGQIIALTGKNGVGKTTLGLILSGLNKESGGTVFLNEKKCGLRARRKAVWYSANDTGTQFFTESVSEEILLSMMNTPDKLERARNVLQTMGLYDLKDVHPATLSGGQKQRLSVACALLSGRSILIFDEPTSGLDGYHADILAKAFLDAAACGKTIIVITHDFELIAACCSFEIMLEGEAQTK